MKDKLNRFIERLKILREESLYRSVTNYTPLSATHVSKDGKDYLMMASNNYLGLTHNLQVKEAAKKAVELYGTGSGGSRLTSGSHILFEKLEQELAVFKSAESALVFNTGYMANVGTISGLMSKNDIIISDELNHASIIDGCRLSRAQCMVYPHKDMNALADILKKLYERNDAVKLIVTDSVFSMDGDIAPLDEICYLASKYDALVMVDDAHATGVLGNGHGSAEYFNLKGKIDIQLGTFSKALASEGGFVAARQVLVDYLINHARSYIFSTALSPADIAAAREALHIIATDNSYVKKLHENVAIMKKYLQKESIEICTQTPIFPIVVHDNDLALNVAKILYDDGIILSAIRPPTVPKNQSRLRLTVTAAHTKEELHFVAEKLGQILKK